ncbi:hypothetical protein JNUCC1_01152 [Lentibacillus sp. JNUCC-1]|nr:hypothetical protein [Lentibacillus sp. JNUCC-1]
MYFLRFTCIFCNDCGRVAIANYSIKEEWIIPIQARGKHGDSSGRISLGETPERGSARRLSSARGKRSVFPERLTEAVIARISVP